MHTIRLRSAWRTEGGRSVRRFNRPSGLEQGTRVAIAWDGDAGDATLNGALVAAGEDVAGRLEPANELSFASADPAVLATVRLEIVEPGEGD